MLLLLLTACSWILEAREVLDTGLDVGRDCDDRARFYVDEDGDGVGDATHSVIACEQPDGTAVEAGDCDDTDASVIEDCDTATTDSG
jgi:hypothetical protein